MTEISRHKEYESNPSDWEAPKAATASRFRTNRSVHPAPKSRSASISSTARRIPGSVIQNDAKLDDKAIAYRLLHFRYSRRMATWRSGYAAVCKTECFANNFKEHSEINRGFTLRDINRLAASSE